MNIDQSPSGTIISSKTGYKAFVPYPLPPKLEWSNELVHSLSRANFLLGKLAREGTRLPNPHLLIHPFIAREAVLSSKIEGTHTTLGELLAIDAGASVKYDPSDLSEVKNYIMALDHGLNRLSEIPLSLRLIKEIHELLMKGVRGFHAKPGEFRNVQNWIGLPGSTINTAKFVPPPPDMLMPCLADFESFLHDRQLPSLIHIGLCHYQFEAIHPFLDGNGRIGRLLIMLLFIEQQILPAPLLYLSAFFEATRAEYYKQLYQVSAQGSWNDWLVYFLNGVAIQAEDVLSRVERINVLLQAWESRIAKDLSIAVTIRQLAANPYCTINKMAQDLGMAYSTANRAIKKLVAAGIIKKINENSRNKVYCATEILSILEEPTKITAT